MTDLTELEKFVVAMLQRGVEGGDALARDTDRWNKREKSKRTGDTIHAVGAPRFGWYGPKSVIQRLPVASRIRLAPSSASRDRGSIAMTARNCEEASSKRCLLYSRKADL